MPDNYLYYGDNLDVLRRKIPAESVDLIYIDPPFNSKRTYNQIYNNIGTEDTAQAQAFIDTWTWDDRAIAGLAEILSNEQGRFTPQTVDLLRGLQPVLGRGGLLAYLVSMTLRVTELQRARRPTGSFYLHCDPTASHYLKLILDAIFVPRGGEYVNELVWCYDIGGRVSKHALGRRHDIIFLYTKGKTYTFNWDQILDDFSESGKAKFRLQDEHGKYRLMGRFIKGSPIKGHRDVAPEWEQTHPEWVYRHYLKAGRMPVDFWNIPPINQASKERLGYPTQKPEMLLERIIALSSNEGDVVLDAYCGCGTTIAAAQHLNRHWMGIDITYQSIALVMARLEKEFGAGILRDIALDGIPHDMAAARALAHKKDDRLRKEFEKWAVLTYTDNRAAINEKKSADAGIDGVAYSLISATDNAKIVLQVKSGHVSRSDVATLHSDMRREGAPMAVLITLEPPTAPMLAEARAIPRWHHPLMGRSYDALQVVTVQDIIERGARLGVPLSKEVLKAAQRKPVGVQPTLLDAGTAYDAGDEDDAEDDGEIDPYDQDW
jgi:DNA modification methylase